MIYLLYGDDVPSSLRTLAKFRARFRRDVPALWREVDCEEDESVEQFTRELGATSLFGGKEYLIVKHATRAEGEASELIGDQIKKWANDDSVIVFFERGVPTKNKLFESIKKSAKAEESKLKTGAVKAPAFRDQDLFAIGDLWGNKDRLKLVATYTKMVDAGFEPGDILRTLLWHVKNVASAALGNTKDMKPFVAQKAMRQAGNFTPHALEESYRALVIMEDKRKSDALDYNLLHFFLTR